MFSLLLHVQPISPPPQLFLPKDLLPSLPTSELHYYQQSAFKSIPALHQDVFCMLILRDMDPSLLSFSFLACLRQLGKQSLRSARTMRISGHHRALSSSCVSKEQHRQWWRKDLGTLYKSHSKYKIFIFLLFRIKIKTIPLRALNILMKLSGGAAQIEDYEQLENGWN